MFEKALIIRDLIHSSLRSRFRGRDLSHNMPVVCIVNMMARKMFASMITLIFTNLFAIICIGNV